jgi:hypothetical protein
VRQRLKWVVAHFWVSGDLSMRGVPSLEQRTTYHVGFVGHQLEDVKGSPMQVVDWRR